MLSWPTGSVVWSRATACAPRRAPLWMLPLPSEPLREDVGLNGLVMGTPPDKKVTMPPGFRPPLTVFTVAVSVTISLATAVLFDEVTVTVVGAWGPVMLTGVDEL